jgi:hypothetical protein
MPREHRLGLRQRWQIFRSEEPAGRDRAQVGDEQVGDEKVAAGLERLGGLLVDTGRKSRRAVPQAEKHPLPPRRQRSALGEGERRVLRCRGGCCGSCCGFAQHHEFAAEEMNAGARVGFQRGDGGGILAPIGGAVERACGIAEIRRNPEFRARQHESLRRAREDSHGPPRCAISPPSEPVGALA